MRRNSVPREQGFDLFYGRVSTGQTLYVGIHGQAFSCSLLPNSGSGFGSIVMVMFPSSSFERQGESRYWIRGSKSPVAIGSYSGQLPDSSTSKRCFEGAGEGLIRTTLAPYSPGARTMACTRSFTK